MNTEIIDYFKKLSQKEYFWINFINSILGIGIIILGIIGLSDGMTVMAYGIMFAAGALMLLLNFYKGIKRGNKNKWLFLIAGIGFGAISALFFMTMK